MTEVNCCVCGESFWLQEATEVLLHRSQATFYCPFGHGQHFNEVKVDDPPDDGENVVTFELIDGGKKP
jgi:hypothetical protein